MQLKKRSIGALSVVGIASLLLVPQIAMSDGGGKYKVTITNLTAGQPFTPPVLVTHSARTGIFKLGDEASAEVQAVSENGNNEPLVAALSGDTYVSQVVEGTAPIIPANNPGGVPFENSATYMISTHGNARYLSFVSMLICTNDGFTGLDSVRLPTRKKTLYAVAYDARTEQNTEDFADMVPPCPVLTGVPSDDMGTGMSNPLLSEKGVVIPHAGINGGADLQPIVHNWGDPVARIVIERMRHGYQ